MRLTFNPDRQQNVYHNLQEARDFKFGKRILAQTDELVKTMKYQDENPDDWARTLPGKVVMCDSNLLSSWGNRYTEAELTYNETEKSATLEAELYPDDRAKKNVKQAMSQGGDQRVIGWNDGQRSLRLEQNLATGVFTMLEE